MNSNERVDQALKILLKHEGEFSNHPSDSGKATMYGVTQATLAKFRGVEEVSVDEVKKLTKGEAMRIYKDAYWRSPNFNNLPQPLDINVFDFGVNASPRRAAKYLQKIINKRAKPKLKMDGMVGIKTLNALRGLDPVELNNEYVDERVAYYSLIVARRPSQEVFLKGWLNRAESFRTDGK